MKHAALAAVLLCVLAAGCASPSAPSTSSALAPTMAQAAWPPPLGIGAADFAVCLRGSQEPACFSAARLQTSAIGAGVIAPGAPNRLNVMVTGNSVTFVWNAPTSGDAILAYIVEAGSVSGAADLANIVMNGTATTFSASGIGAGTYFVRVRALNAGGGSPPSNEVVVVVGSIGCTSAPGAPGGLSGSVNGGTVTLVWTPPAGGCAPTSYTLQAGSAPGLSNLANFNTGNSATTYVASGVGQGTYFVRVHAVNGNGTSGPSNEVSLTVGPIIVGTDATWSVDNGRPAALVDADCIPFTWGSTLASAQWIWSSPCTATDAERHTFSKQFVISGGGASARLEAAADNVAFVTINGQRMPTTLCIDYYNMGDATICGYSRVSTFDVTGLLRTGQNATSLEVRNFPVGMPPGWRNPAGLLARLTIQ